MIQDSAEGRMTSMVRRREPAPRMRALAIRLRSTSRTPWKALKKTTKKTRTAAVATLERRSRPSDMANSAPSTTRGIEFAALMKGAKTSDSIRLRPSSTPATMPSAVPTTKPSTVSSMVTATCCQSGPRAVPWVIHVYIRLAIPEGMPKKKGSTMLSRVVSSQLPSQTAAARRRRPWTMNCRRRLCRRLSAARSASCGAGFATCSASTLLTLIAHLDLVAKVAPDLLVDPLELWLEADLRDVAGRQEGDRIAAFDRARAGREDVDPVGE